jgi:hypothetical protein
MNQRLLHIAAIFVVVVSTASSAPGQDSVAEVQTWGGDTWRIAEPSMDVLYTIVPTPVVDQSGVQQQGHIAPGGSNQTSMLPVGGGPVPTIIGSLRSLSSVFGRGPEPLRARRAQSTLTLVRDGVEITIPFDRITSLVVQRQHVTGSPLPPYVAGGHVRYSAIAVLSDGSTIEADYVNFGTAMLRGIGPQGHVEIPFEDVRSLKIIR